MNIDDRIHSLTTIVDVTASDIACSGTGFFYHVLAPSEPDAGSGWRRIVSNWLITNRHVLLPKDEISGEERTPETVSFRLRTNSEDGSVVWVNVELGPESLAHNVRLHKDSEVDVVAVDITKDLHGLLKESVPLSYSAVGESEFPGADKISVSVATDVVVVGYPKGYYDSVNKYPVVKSGLIASRWNANFEGKPTFLIDAKLFPGSSGSIVLTKPVDIVAKDGQVFSSKEKQFSFLGIFSGEPYQLSKVPVETDDGLFFKKDYFNLGLVWYYSVLPQILSEGQTLGELIQSRSAAAAV